MRDPLKAMLAAWALGVLSVGISPASTAAAAPERAATPASAEVVRLAFAQRRKQLRNTLKTVLAADAIEAAGVDPAARAETLDLAAYVRLAEAIPPR